jgi:hypothetical protein
MWLHLHAGWKVYGWFLRSLLADLYCIWIDEQLVYTAELLLRDVRLPRALGREWYSSDAYEAAGRSFLLSVVDPTRHHDFTNPLLYNSIGVIFSGSRCTADLNNLYCNLVGYDTMYSCRSYRVSEEHRLMPQSSRYKGKSSMQQTFWILGLLFGPGDGS